MKIFDILNNKIVLSPQSLYIPEFKALWDRDKTKDKSKCIQEITYIVFLCDNSEDNPYSNFGRSDRELIVKTDYPIEMDSQIELAIDKFEKLNTTRYERVVMAALDSLGEVENYYKSIRNRSVDVEFDIIEYLNTTEKLGKAFESLKKLEISIHSDRIQNSRIVGKGEVGDYEL